MLTDNRSRHARAVMKIVGYTLAIGLLVASIWYALQGQRLSDWWAMLRDDPWLTAGLFATVAVSSIVIPGMQFWLVTRPFVTGRPLSLAGMQALTAGGCLLNYTPFKAGMIGRVTYLKHFHGVGLRAAVFTNVLIGIIFVASSILTIAITIWRGEFDLAWWATTLGGIGILTGIAAKILQAVLPAAMPVEPRLRNSTGAAVAYLAPCFAFQLLGLYVTAIRWWLVFHILGRPIALADAWLAAIVHMVTIAAGPANGIGLREWLIGIGGQLGGINAGLNMDLRMSMSAALIDRAIEAVVLILLGVLGLAFLRYMTRDTTINRTDAR